MNTELKNVTLTSEENGLSLEERFASIAGKILSQEDERFQKIAVDYDALSAEEKESFCAYAERYFHKE